MIKHQDVDENCKHKTSLGKITPISILGFFLIFFYLCSLRRFRLHFEKDSKENVEKGKKLAREKVLKPVSEKELEISIDDIYPPEKGLSVVFP